MKIWLVAIASLILACVASTAQASSCAEFATQIHAADRAYDLMLKDLEPDYMIPYLWRDWRCDAVRGAAMLLRAQVERQSQAQKECSGTITFPRDLSSWEWELASMWGRMGAACAGKEELRTPDGAGALWEVCSCFSLQQLDPGAGKHRRFRAVNACSVPIWYAYLACHVSRDGKAIGNECGPEHGYVAAGTTDNESGHSDYRDATLLWACSPGVPCCRRRR